MKTKEKLKKLCKNINNLYVNFACIFILFCVIFSSFDTAYGSHIRFYEKVPNKNIATILNTIRSQYLFNLFRSNTGLNTGYGFFSPNVSSDLLIYNKFFIKDRVVYKKSDWLLNTKEGKHRFSNLNNSFMDYLDEIDKNDTIQKDSLKINYYKMIVNRLNSYNLKNNNKIDSIETTVYLYHFPFLKEYPNIQPNLIKIEQQTKKKP
jgi:hypothetical protein